MLRRIGTAFVVVLLLAAGVFGFVTLKSGKEAPARRPSAAAPAVVETVTAQASTARAVVKAAGTVVPVRSLSVIPQVGGALETVHPDLQAGRRIAAGETLLSIADRDYALVVNQRKANVKAAELELTTERSRKKVAAAEWELLGGDVKPTAEGKSLALREAQLDNAAAQVTSAKSVLSAARLDLKRTKITAPFDALVLSESIEVGQVVAPGATVATLVATAAFRVQAEVPVDRLGWLRIPGVNATTDEPGSPARVLQVVGDETVERAGHVVGLLGQLDAKSRTARVLVEVPDPLTPKGPGTGLPLLLDSHVAVEIEGPALDGLVALPRGAVSGGKTWVIADGTLQPRSVALVWSHDGTAHVRGDLLAGEEVVTTRLDAPVAGMTVARADAPASSPERTRPGTAERTLAGLHPAEEVAR